MAVNSDKVSSQFQLVFQEGLDGEGNAILRTKSFNNVKVESTADQLHSVAAALEPLQQYTIYAMERNDGFVIYEV